MGKIRIYKLAKELNIQSKELVDILQDLDIDVTSHMSTIEDETAKLIRDMYKDDKKKDDKKKDDKKNAESEKKEQEIDEKHIEEEEENGEILRITTPITVKELAELIEIGSNNIIKSLIGLGVMATVNDPIDDDLLEILADELNFNYTLDSSDLKEDFVIERVQEEQDDEENLKLRPPIVTVMGHVDHGKTTLLDEIRKTRVTETEAGGITQHIGAYQVEINNKNITFIDTPGHEAFTEMRARGAQVTDIAVLVVAADDGIMPQTIEAINHAKAANIPIIVAINKIDKANAQPERVKQELTEYGLVPEDWGGNTITVDVSALKNINIDELLEMIILQSEMEELKANPDRLANGIVIESSLDRGRGPVATVLIKNGTLRVGNPLLSGLSSGRVRAMFDYQGKGIDEAKPSQPVEVLGFSDVPAAGSLVEVLEDEKEARQIAGERKNIQHQKDIKPESKISLEDLYQQIQEGELKELTVIIKADVHGSIEALKASLLKLETDEVGVKVIHTGVGAINETDVNLASASNAIIIGFNVRPDSNARSIADKEGVDIRLYRVIYKAIEDIKDAMAGLLDPELKEVTRGLAEVRATFKVPDIGTIAGVYIKKGIVNRNYKVRLLRDGVVKYEGNISSLKRFEDDVREVKEGYECGVGIENYNDIKNGDTLELYDFEEIKRSL